MSIKSNQVRVPQRLAQERNPKLKAPSTRTFVSGRVLVVAGGTALIAVTALAAVFWPQSPRAKSGQSERPAVAVATPPAADPIPTKPDQPVKHERAPEEKVTSRVPATAVDPKPTPESAPAGEPPATRGVDPKPAPEPLPAAPPLRSPAPPSRTTESYGTCVEFLSNPTQAAQKAMQEQKLLFTVHISGNFEDARFT